MPAIAGGSTERIAGTASTCRAMTPGKREEAPSLHIDSKTTPILLSVRHCERQRRAILSTTKSKWYGNPKVVDTREAARPLKVADRAFEPGRSLAQDDESTFESRPAIAVSRAPHSNRPGAATRRVARARVQ